MAELSVKRGKRAPARRRLRLWSLPSMREAKGLFLLGGGYLLGSLLGVALAGAMEGESLAALQDYLERFCFATGEGDPARWYTLLWPSLRWLLLALALRFTALGTLLLPALLGAKGFLLSFAVSAFVRSFDLRGLGAAVLVFGPPELAATLALFLLALDSWRCLGRGGEPLWTRRELRSCGAGLLAVALAALVQSAGEEWLVKGLRLLLL